MNTYDAAVILAEQLAKSERGAACLTGLHTFLESHGWSLDAQNQRAVIDLVKCFQINGHDTLDAILETVPKSSRTITLKKGKGVDS